MAWDESKHPRDDGGKFTYSNGGNSPSKTVFEGQIEKTVTADNSADMSFPETTKKENELKLRNKLLDVLGNLAEREEILYATVPELINKIKEHGLENKLKQSLTEAGLNYLYNFPGYQFAKWKYGKDTVGMVDLAHEEPKNPNYAVNTIELNSYKDIEDLSDRKYLEDKLREQFKDYGFDPKTIKGRIFKSNTEPSQRVAQDKDFLETIKNNKEKIINGEQISGNFPRYKDDKESNWHFAIGHYDLRNGYLDKRGNLHIKMYDTYDFNKDNKTSLNQAGRNQMMKGNLKPSFSIHDIIVPNYVIDKIWQKND